MYGEGYYRVITVREGTCGLWVTVLGRLRVHGVSNIFFSLSAVPILR